MNIVGEPFQEVYDVTDKILADTWLRGGGIYSTDGSEVNLNGIHPDDRLGELRLSIEDPQMRNHLARFIQALPTIGSHKPYVNTWLHQDVLHVSVFVRKG